MQTSAHCPSSYILRPLSLGDLALPAPTTLLGEPWPFPLGAYYERAGKKSISPAVMGPENSLDFCPL